MKLRELDERQGHGIVVSLLYDKAAKAVLLRVSDHGTEYEPVTVPAGEARQAFDHPFLYVEDTVEQEPEPKQPRPDIPLDDLRAAVAQEWNVDEGGEEATV